MNRYCRALVGLLFALGAAMGGAAQGGAGAHAAAPLRTPGTAFSHPRAVETTNAPAAAARTSPTQRVRHFAMIRPHSISHTSMMALLARRIAEVRQQRQLRDSGHATSSCQQGDWVGLPFVNRFFNSDCTTYVEGVTLGGQLYCLGPNNTDCAYYPDSLTLDSGQTDFIEATVSIPSGTSLTVPADTQGGTPQPPNVQIDDSIYVSGTLTFGAGAVATLVGAGGTNTAIFVNNGGSLAIDGTGTGAGQQVVLTGQGSSGAGTWGRIETESGSTTSISYAQISDGGGLLQLEGCGCTASAGMLILGGTVSITNSDLDTTNNVGIDVEEASPLPTLTNDTVTNCTSWPIYYGNMIPDTTGLTGLQIQNDNPDAVGINNGTISASGTWENPGTIIGAASQVRGAVISGTNQIPLSVTGRLFLNSGDVWTIAPGTLIESTTGFYINGTLKAIGSALDPAHSITFTSPSGTPGSWGRIELTTGSSNSVLSYVNILDAGASLLFEGVGYGTSTGMVVNGGATPKITHTVIDHSAASGIEVANGSPTLLNDTITNSAGVAIQYDSTPNDLSNLSGLQFSGNHPDAITLNGTSISTTSTWPAPGSIIGVGRTIPYILNPGNDVYLNSGVTWTVKPGVIIELSDGSGLFISGTLNMNGTASRKITLTSANATPQPGDWSRIELDSGSDASSISFVHLSYGGYPHNFPGVGYGPSTGLYIGSTAATIQNSTIDHSSGSDVEVSASNASVQPTLSADGFGAVPSGQVALQNDTGNPVNAIDNFWGDPSGPTTTANPGGRGFGISGAVTFSPWLFSAPGTLFLSPVTAAPGSALRVAASGYTPGETVGVTLDGTQIVAPTADGNGSFLVTVPAPAAPAGSHTLAATGSSSATSFSTPLKITPKLTLSRILAVPGTPFTVSGAGYGANETVTLTLTSSKTSCTGTSFTPTGSTDTTGSFNGVSLVVPAVKAGIYYVCGHGSTSGAQSLTQLTIKPTITMKPIRGSQGTAVTVSGAGFGTGESISFTFNATGTSCSGAALSGTVTTDSTGSFGTFSSTTPGAGVTIPSNPAGTYFICATGETSGIHASASFTLLPSLQLSAASGHAGDTVSVSGNGFGASESVTFTWNTSHACSGTPLSGTASTDASGNFGTFSGSAPAASITVPAVPTGTYFLCGTGGTSAATALASYKVN